MVSRLLETVRRTERFVQSSRALDETGGLADASCRQLQVKEAKLAEERERLKAVEQRVPCAAR